MARERHEAHAYLAGICRKRGAETRAIGGIGDHVHILCTLPRDTPLPAFVREIKRASTIWIRNRYAHLTDFAWQNGYCALSVSPSGLGGVFQYIENQEKHHRNRDFNEEIHLYMDQYEQTVGTHPTNN